MPTSVGPLSVVMKMLRREPPKEYLGPTFGLRTMGIPVHEVDLEGAVAEVPAFGRRMHVSSRHGLTRPTAEHELEHLRQKAELGWKYVPTVAYQKLVAILKGQDPDLDIPLERAAYAREDLTKKREAAEWQARVQQYAAEKRKKPKSVSEKVRDKDAPKP